MFENEFESIPMAFWETLGQYVYGYREDDKFVYIGKGNKNRAISHVKSKDYSTDNLYIIARNLESFRDDKDDLQSFILESYLISLYDPRDNSVAGHHKECFVMAKFSELFEEFQKDQHDNFESLPDWFTENYSVFLNRINRMSITSGNHSMELATRQHMQCFLDVSTEDSVSLKVAVWAKKDDVLNMRHKQLRKFCESFGISEDKIQKSGNREIYSIDDEGMTMEVALQSIDDFYS